MFIDRIGLFVLLGALAFPQGETGTPLPALPLRGPVPEVVLTGRVTDGTTGSPLQGTQISILEESYGTLTNRNGEYTLNFPDGWIERTVTVVVQHIGYATAQNTVGLKEGSNTFDLGLSPTALALDAVMTASRVKRCGMVCVLLC